MRCETVRAKKERKGVVQAGWAEMPGLDITGYKSLPQHSEGLQLRWRDREKERRSKEIRQTVLKTLRIGMKPLIIITNVRFSSSSPIFSSSSLFTPSLRMQVWRLQRARHRGNVTNLVRKNNNLLCGVKELYHSIWVWCSGLSTGEAKQHLILGGDGSGLMETGSTRWARAIGLIRHVLHTPGVDGLGDGKGVSQRNMAGAKEVVAGLYLTSPTCGLHLARCVCCIPSLTVPDSAESPFIFTHKRWNSKGITTRFHWGSDFFIFLRTYAFNEGKVYIYRCKW